MFSENNMPSAKTLVSTAASIAASAMVVRSVARDLVPYEIQQYFFSKIRFLFKSYSSEVTLIIEELDGFGFNQIYKAAEIYLGSKVSSPSTRIFKVSMAEKESKIVTSMAKNQGILDTFQGIQFKWRQVTTESESKQQVRYPGHPSAGGSRSETRCFMLIFHKKHKQIVLDSYFPFVLEESKKIKDNNKTLKIHTLNNDQMMRYTGAANSWSSLNLDHPSTFQTLAIDQEVKKEIMEDLAMFVRRKEYYRRVGKAWKRGYLLYGPPGTGKSSLIAAMANYLNFDIYDLDLTNISSNSELRRLLVTTANRCILVVEDIDCGLELEDRKTEEQRILKMLQSNQMSQAQTINIVRQKKTSQITLSGLLNFIDGLWSSCGDERIIVFTTNHKDRLDPALLRPGRMDVHIHMSYCTPCGFKTLAVNYLGLNRHPLFSEIEDLLEKTTVTPAEIGEQLLKCEEPETALQGLVQFLIEKKKKKKEEDEMELERKRKQEEVGNNDAEGEKGQMVGSQVEENME